MNYDELLKLIQLASRNKATKLDLSLKGLTVLPDSIGKLISLTHLDLSDNQLMKLPDSIGNLTGLINLNLQGNRLTKLPDSIGNLTRLIQFAPNGNQLTNLPDSIGNLTSLIQFDLNDNQLTNLPDSIGNLTDLTQLYLNNNRLMSLPESIGQLINLTQLYVGNNRLMSLPESIGNLTNLKQIYLDNNRLASLPESIGNLTNLIQLHLWSNRLTSLPKSIGYLTRLTQLDLRYNQLSNLPTSIGKLVDLTQLDLRRNRLTSLPTSIKKLTNLTQLDLWSNQLRNLPVEIEKLTNLNQLSIGNNQLTSLPPEIGNLINLTLLDLANNHLVNLPLEIGNLIRLIQLDLGNNQLLSLPVEIGKLTNLSSLSLDDNPLMSLPPELRQKKGSEILDFYRQQLEQEIDRIYEAKLLIVGEGGAGKTTLAKKIQDSAYQLQTDEGSTKGIDIIYWNFRLPNGKEFRVNIWDFGGQEIYHSTHQFFLTKRSLYAVVADTRKEDTDFYYWLNVAELLSESSPLLIINNERQDRKREINERQLRGEFTNLKETLSTNFATNRGLSEIINTIQYYIQKLPHIGNELPKTWVKVREILEQDERNYISLEEYIKICYNNGFRKEKDAIQLSGYLHDLGVCLHFREDNLLVRIVILKPSWGTDAVYKVLDNPQVIQKLGKFSSEDLKVIWCEDKYANMHPELLRLMINFKLCYEIPRSPEINSPHLGYIAPQLLTLNQPIYKWIEKDNLVLRYEYEFMPKGILTRFIVEMHLWIKEKIYVWKNGVILSKDETEAEVIEQYHKGEICIRVRGKRKRDLLTTIKHELDKIHVSYERLKYKTLFPCSCLTCKKSQTPFFFDLNRLYKFLDAGKLSIQCHESGDEVKVFSLIDDIVNISSQFTNPMSETSKYIIKAKIVQIVESNSGEVIAKKYANDSAFTDALTEIVQILTTLQQKYPAATEAEAEEIIETEFTKIQTKQPKKWETFCRQLLNTERWFNGGKAALSETAKHYLENNVFSKAGIAFLEGFSADEG